MSKALVIKGANFSANKVTTIIIDSPIPCTGISLATDAVTIDSEEAVTVSYSVTPYNTTDSVSWSSSNSDIAEVVNGVITPKGNGSCVVTATCGQYSASASVTVNIPVSWDYEWGYGSYTNNHISGTTNYSRLSVFADTQQAATYGVLWNNSITLYPIKIPSSAGSVKVSYDTSKSSMIYNNSENLYVEWFKDEPSPDSGFSEYAYFLERTRADLRNNGSITAQVPTGAESFYITLRLASTYTSDEDPVDIADELGLTLEFI